MILCGYCVFPRIMIHEIACTYMALIALSVPSVVSVAYLLYVRHLGGILAVANIRGGGEYGLNWHKGTDITQKS